MAEEDAWCGLHALRQDKQEEYTIYNQLTELFRTFASMELKNEHCLGAL